MQYLPCVFFASVSQTGLKVKALVHETPGKTNELTTGLRGKHARRSIGSRFDWNELADSIGTRNSLDDSVGGALSPQLLRTAGAGHVTSLAIASTRSGGLGEFPAMRVITPETSLLHALGIGFRDNFTETCPDQFTLVHHHCRCSEAFSLLANAGELHYVAGVI